MITLCCPVKPRRQVTQGAQAAGEGEAVRIPEADSGCWISRPAVWRPGSSPDARELCAQRPAYVVPLGEGYGIIACERHLRLIADAVSAGQKPSQIMSAITGALPMPWTAEVTFRATGGEPVFTWNACEVTSPDQVVSIEIDLGSTGITWTPDGGKRPRLHDLEGCWCGWRHEMKWASELGWDISVLGDRQIMTTDEPADEEPQP